MQDGGEGSRRTPDNDESSQTPSSYVYPIKSLLTGIQPAPPTQSRPSIPRRSSSHSGGLAALQDLLTHQLASTRKKPTEGLDVVSPQPMSSRSHSMFHPYTSRTALAGPSDDSEVRLRKAPDPLSSRMRPIESQSSLPTALPEPPLPPASVHPSIPASSSSLPPSQSNLSALDDSPSDTSPVPLQSPVDEALTPDEYKPPQGLTEHLLNEESRASPAHSVRSHVSHMSQSGIVHLPPLSSASGSSRAASRGSGSHTHNSSRKYYLSSGSNISSQRMGHVPEVEEERKAEDCSSRPSSNPKSVEPDTQQGGSEPTGDFITTRYRHETDENGNHLVIGREGDIRRCEDEVRAS